MLEAKIEAKKAEIEQKRSKEGKYKRYSWSERFGRFRIAYIFVWGVLAGASYMFAYLQAPQLFESHTTYITNVVKAEVKKDMTTSNNLTTSDIADKIWLYESSRGKNNYSVCGAQGKVNGIGYGIDGSGGYMCFNSHEQEMKVLEGWIESKFAQGLTEKELLCLYNTGEVTENCEYASK
jgi:hypothetical protein